MAVLDIVILAVLAIGIWRGFSSGLIREVAGVLGLLFAFALGAYLMESAGLILYLLTGLSEKTASLVGFVVVFLAVLLTIHVLAYLVEYIIGAIRLGPVNRVLGGAAGAFKAALVLSVVFLVLNPFGYPQDETRTRSTLYEPIEHLAPATWSFVSTTWPDLDYLSRQLGKTVEGEVVQVKAGE